MDKNWGQYERKKKENFQMGYPPNSGNFNPQQNALQGRPRSFAVTSPQPQSQGQQNYPSNYNRQGLPGGRALVVSPGNMNGHAQPNMNGQQGYPNNGNNWNNSGQPTQQDQNGQAEGRAPAKTGGFSSFMRNLDLIFN